MPASRPWPKHQTPTASDLVNRQFTGPATEHPSREGKVYCAVVLDACIASDAVESPTPGAGAIRVRVRMPTRPIRNYEHPVNAMFKNWHVLRTLRGCAR